MKYHIELSETALADLRDATRWLRNQASERVADRWLAGVHRAMNTLASKPLRCPIAAENDKFPEEIRELLHGGRKPKHRIIFTVRENTVVILFVRHSARDELEP